jgi:hypothetical protein
MHAATAPVAGLSARMFAYGADHPVAPLVLFSLIGLLLSAVAALYAPLDPDAAATLLAAAT